MENRVPPEWGFVSYWPLRRPASRLLCLPTLPTRKQQGCRSRCARTASISARSTASPGRGPPRRSARSSARGGCRWTASPAGYPAGPRPAGRRSSASGRCPRPRRLGRVGASVPARAARHRPRHRRLFRRRDRGRRPAVPAPDGLGVDGIAGPAHADRPAGRPRRRSESAAAVRRALGRLADRDRAAVPDDCALPRARQQARSRPPAADRDEAARAGVDPRAARRPAGRGRAT